MIKVTDLKQLRHFMKPYYQTDDDNILLNDYLTTYTYPECAAGKLWEELGGSKGLGNEGLLKMSTGAEKFEYGTPGTMQLACEKQAKLYNDRCNDIHNIGSCAVKVNKATVANVTEFYGSSE
jgi:hypothetical protein